MVSALVGQVRRRAATAVIGGAAGYETGGVKGAAIGAAAGAVAAQAVPGLSEMLLQKMLANPKTAGVMETAVKHYMDGNYKLATSMTSRALADVGAPGIIKHILKPPKEQAPRPADVTLPQ